MTDLGSSLTIHLSRRELERLRTRARSLGTTPSAVLRSLLEREIGELDGHAPTLGERSRRWVGAVNSAQVPHGRSARAALGALPGK